MPFPSFPTKVISLNRGLTHNLGEKGRSLSFSSLVLTGHSLLTQEEEEEKEEKGGKEKKQRKGEEEQRKGWEGGERGRRGREGYSYQQLWLHQSPPHLQPTATESPPAQPPPPTPNTTQEDLVRAWSKRWVSRHPL